MLPKQGWELQRLLLVFLKSRTHQAMGELVGRVPMDAALCFWKRKESKEPSLFGSLDYSPLWALWLGALVFSTRRLASSADVVRLWGWAPILPRKRRPRYISRLLRARLFRLYWEDTWAALPPASKKQVFDTRLLAVLLLGRCVTTIDGKTRQVDNSPFYQSLRYSKGIICQSLLFQTFFIARPQEQIIPNTLFFFASINLDAA